MLMSQPVGWPVADLQRAKETVRTAVRGKIELVLLGAKPAERPGAPFWTENKIRVLLAILGIVGTAAVFTYEHWYSEGTPAAVIRQK